LHASKGLEYPIVILTGMEEKLFPHEHALRGTQEAIEEERRLCYVGITRAQTELHITHARKRVLYGKVIITQKSRFLGELAHTPSPQQPEARPHDEIPAPITPSAGGAIAKLPSPTPPLAPVSAPSLAPTAEPDSALSVGDRVEHPSRGSATIIAAEGLAVTAVFDREPGKPYEMHARLARLRRLT
ncbi:MAG: 3'-5' exonuclease, partial [Solirubrobacteraceae bacterium]